MAAQLPGPARPTLRQIAERLGVTAATVSLALRDSPQISSETRARVKLAADAMGYSPDPEVGKLMQRLRQPKDQRTHTTLCALVDADQTREPRTAAILDGARTRAQSLGFALHLEVLPRDEANCARLHRTLVHRNIEGLLLLGSRLPSELCPSDLSRAFAVVATSPYVAGPDFDRVLEHRDWATSTLVRQLASTGHRRIGLVCRVDCDPQPDNVLTAPSAFAPQAPRLGVFTYRDARTLGAAEANQPSLAAWLAQVAPQALIVDDENIAEVLARHHGGESTPVITSLARLPGSSLAGIVQPWAEVGAAAIDALHKKLLTGQRGLSAVPFVTLLKGRWVPIGA